LQHFTNFKKFGKAQLSKLKFMIGLSPEIQPKVPDAEKYIPHPFKSVCLISADFELAWASRYSKSCAQPLQKAINDGLQTRRNVPKILSLCENYGIPITWATVGHLFLDACKPVNGAKHPDLPRLPYFENKYWKFSKGDWFDYDPCTDMNTDPAWYAPDLIDNILASRIKHEVGCHTFSHVDCRDSVDEGRVFEAEIRKCIGVAKEKGLILNSFVHPGHTIGHLELLQKMGFTSFRSDYGDTLGYPVLHHGSLWELKNTAGLEWRQGWSAAYHIFRYKTIIDRAIRHKRVCVLWFHPSFSSQFMDTVMPGILKHLAERSDDIKCLTHSEYARFLSSRINM